MGLPGKVSLRKAMEETGGVVSDLATHFTVTRQTIYRWIDHYEMRAELSKARTSMREVAKDVLYEKLMEGDANIAMFVMRHMRDDGEMIVLPPDVLALMESMGISSSDVVTEWIALMRSAAANQRQVKEVKNGA